MDPLFMAYSYFRRRKFEKCCEICSTLLEKNHYDKAAWLLKLRALTEMMYVDEVEIDEQGIAEQAMDDNTLAQVARPGTSMNVVTSSSEGGASQALRPSTRGGRPVSGFVRPATQSGNTGMEQALRTPRTAHTARPVTTGSGRFVRLGTASMLSNPDGSFINVSRLNFGRYAQRQTLAKALFEYLFHHENDVRNGLDLAAMSTEAIQFDDWWWKIQLGKCYYRLGMYRDAEQQFRSALKQQAIIDSYLFLAKVYTRLDQPLTAIETYKEGLTKFPNDTSLLTGIARIHEAMNKLSDAVEIYREVLKSDCMHVEAIACLGTHHFYNGQPEVALKFYRRLLQMSVHNSELYNNLGLCCFYAQQYDMTLTCFERALSLANDDPTIADVWYNVGHTALGIGDMNLAFQAFRMTLTHNSDHAEAYNNLGVLEFRKGHLDQSRTFFQAAATLAPLMYEPHYNFGSISDKVGDFQSSFNAVQRALDCFPEHMDSKILLKELKMQFSLL